MGPRGDALRRTLCPFVKTAGLNCGSTEKKVAYISGSEYAFIGVVGVTIKKNRAWITEIVRCLLDDSTTCGPSWKSWKLNDR